MSIRHAASQSPVTNGSVQALFQSGNVKPFACIIQYTAIQRFIEMTFVKLLCIEKTKYRTVDDQRLKQFGDIKCQRKSAGTGFV
jgi:hypothetical protein